MPEKVCTRVMIILRIVVIPFSSRNCNCCMLLEHKIRSVLSLSLFAETHLHWNGNVGIMRNFLSLSATEVLLPMRLVKKILLNNTHFHYHAVYIYIYVCMYVCMHACVCCVCVCFFASKFVKFSNSLLGGMSLTNLPLDKLVAISQTAFSNAFSWMKSFVFWIDFHWNLFLRT